MSKTTTPNLWIVQDGYGHDYDILGTGATPAEAIACAEEQVADFLGDPIDWTHMAEGTPFEAIVGVYKAHAALRREIIIRPVPAAVLSETVFATAA